MADKGWRFYSHVINPKDSRTSRILYMLNVFPNRPFSAPPRFSSLSVEDAGRCSSGGSMLALTLG